jgi:hypothetical protein
LVLLVVGLIIGAGVTFLVVPPQTTTTTAPPQTTTTTAPPQTTTTVLTLIRVPVIHTQVETISNLITGVETLTYTLEETSTTTASNPFATIPFEYVYANGSTPFLPVPGVQAGTLNVTLSVSPNKEIDFEIMNSVLYNQSQYGKSVQVCPQSVPSIECNLNQDAAKVGTTSGSLFFQITTPGTYYILVDNDYSGNSSVTISGILGMASHQTTTYVVTTTSLSTTTATNQTITTMTDTTYTTSTDG